MDPHSFHVHLVIKLGQPGTVVLSEAKKLCKLGGIFGISGIKNFTSLWLQLGLAQRDYCDKKKMLCIFFSTKHIKL